MTPQFAIAAIRKNGFLVYKSQKSKDIVICKSSDYNSDKEFKNAVIKFSSKEAAEDFIKENKLVSVEAVEFII
jgi:hypothetical protein